VYEVYEEAVAIDVVLAVVVVKNTTVICPFVGKDISMRVPSMVPLHQ
jgi:hypothetical protein